MANRTQVFETPLNFAVFIPCWTNTAQDKEPRKHSTKFQKVAPCKYEAAHRHL